MQQPGQKPSYMPASQQPYAAGYGTPVNMTPPQGTNLSNMDKIPKLTVKAINMQATISDCIDVLVLLFKPIELIALIFFF